MQPKHFLEECSIGLRVMAVDDCVSAINHFTPSPQDSDPRVTFWLVFGPTSKAPGRRPPHESAEPLRNACGPVLRACRHRAAQPPRGPNSVSYGRSEEHTSELQSLTNLV